MANLADKETELSNAFVSEGNGDREGDGVNTASTKNSHIEINSHETSSSLLPLLLKFSSLLPSSEI